VLWAHCRLEQGTQADSELLAHCRLADTDSVLLVHCRLADTDSVLLVHCRLADWELSHHRRLAQGRLADSDMSGVCRLHRRSSWRLADSDPATGCLFQLVLHCQLSAADW